jgi:hypothetical protein
MKWTDTKPLQMRPHVNGRMGEVRLQRDGKFYVREVSPAFSDGSTAEFAAGVSTLAGARRIADSLVHTGCTGQG